MNPLLRLVNLLPRCLPAAGVVALAGFAQAQPSLDWSLIGGIGGVSTSGQVAIAGASSTHDAVFMANGRLSLHSVIDPWAGFFTQSPPEPTLMVSLATNHIILRWPAQFTGYHPASASMLQGQGTIWTTVMESPVMVGNEFHLALPAAAPFRFYRLRLE